MISDNTNATFTSTASPFGNAAQSAVCPFGIYPPAASASVTDSVNAAYPFGIDPHSVECSGGVDPDGEQESGPKRVALSNRSNKEALSLSEIYEQLWATTNGWPRVVGGRLCVTQNDMATGRQKPFYLTDANSFFAWLDQYCQVSWHSGDGVYTKNEFVSYVEQHGELYRWATDLFHCPPLPGVLYTHNAPQPAKTGRLDELMGMFNPHTDSDRLLLKAYACTPFWGGPPGKRPLFVLATADAENDPNTGRGSGKSTIAQTVGKISGGCVPLYRESEMNKVVSDLLSPDGMGVRSVLMDNVKALKFSSQFVESLITTDEIGGHMMYKGHGSRPNYITYVVTANEPMLSTDLATRSIPILINQSQKSAAWDSTIEAMLKDQHFLEELYADIAWWLTQPTKDIEEDNSERWALWWKEVVSRICTDAPELYQARDEVKRRRKAVDADLSSRESVDEILRYVMTQNGIPEPDKVAVFFPTIILKTMLIDILGRNCSLPEAGQRVNAMKPQNLYHRKNGPDNGPRGYWWFGENCDQFCSEKYAASGSQHVFQFVEDPASVTRYRMKIVHNKTSMRNALNEARGKTKTPA